MKKLANKVGLIAFLTIVFNPGFSAAFTSETVCSDFAQAPGLRVKFEAPIAETLIISIQPQRDDLAQESACTVAGEDHVGPTFSCAPVRFGEIAYKVDIITGGTMAFVKRANVLMGDSTEQFHLVCRNQY